MYHLKLKENFLVVDKEIIRYFLQKNLRIFNLFYPKLVKFYINNLKLMIVLH